MRVGDILELAGAGAAAAAAYLQWGIKAALVIAALTLIYEGQCFGAQPLPRPRLPRLLKRRTAEPADAGDAGEGANQ